MAGPVAVPEFADDRVRGVEQEARDPALGQVAPAVERCADIVEILGEDEEIALEPALDAIAEPGRRREEGCMRLARQVGVRKHGERTGAVDMLHPGRHGLVIERHVAGMVAVVAQDRYLQLVPDGGGIGVGGAELHAHALPRDDKVDPFFVEFDQPVRHRIVDMDDVRRAPHPFERLFHAGAEIGEGIVLPALPVKYYDAHICGREVGERWGCHASQGRCGRYNLQQLQLALGLF